MEVERVEKMIVSSNHDFYEFCDNLCFQSKNLYNLANYYIRQVFIPLGKEEILPQQQEFIDQLNRKIPSFDQRRKSNREKREQKNPEKYKKKKFKTTSSFDQKNKFIGYDFLEYLMRGEDAYHALPQQSAQQTLRLLSKDWKSFFVAIKDYGINPDKYQGCPNLPKYKKKDGRQIAIFTNQQCKLRDCRLSFPKSNLKLKTSYNGKFQQVRIVPRGSCYCIEIVYKKEIPGLSDSQTGRIVGIDLGVDNFATCANNIGLEPIIINGKDVKSINQYYNKEKARSMSYVGSKGSSRKIEELTVKRNQKVENYLHKASRKIIDYCFEHQIDTVVVGNNQQWKQEINLGRVTNQNFVNLPHATFIKQLQYKGEDVGIRVISHEESYTSKASFLDRDQIPVYKSGDKTEHRFSGKRIRRGLYRSSDGTLINADVNAAYNIIRKVFPDVLSEGIEGVGFRPLRINILAKR